MKVVIKNDSILLFLNKYYKQIDLTNKENLQKYIKELLLKLQDDYNLELSGYYDITLYKDEYYGIILEIKKEELEYLDYFNSTIEINTKIIEDSFLYEVNNLEKIKNTKPYILKDKIYLQIIKDIQNIEQGLLLEKVIRIIYGQERKNIIKQVR